jgi:dihydrodipicolinate synthase/N-acetylneuraminate lyase
MPHASAPISGILTPHMVPLDPHGRIDEVELARYVTWLIDRGVHGLYPNGSTGEFVRFSGRIARSMAPPHRSSG